MANLKTQEKPFPKFMKTENGYLVFFTKERCGICLGNPNQSPDIIGSYIENWSMDGFFDYNEPITLQNA